MAIRHKVDEKYRIVDFYIEDESGKEHHAGLTFAAAKEFAEDILWGMNNPQGDKEPVLGSSNVKTIILAPVGGHKKK